MTAASPSSSSSPTSNGVSASVLTCDRDLREKTDSISGHNSETALYISISGHNSETASSDDKVLDVAFSPGAPFKTLLGGERVGFLIRGWEIESRKHSTLSSSLLQEWEDKLQTFHLPEIISGEICLILKHTSSGIKVHFNAFDALCGSKQEGLPPVEVPAAAKWKFRIFEVFLGPMSHFLLTDYERVTAEVTYNSNPNDQVILDYDYTFTTPYCGIVGVEKMAEEAPEESRYNPHWVDCLKRIDMATLATKEPIIFYDEVGKSLMEKLSMPYVLAAKQLERSQQIDEASYRYTFMAKVVKATWID